MTRAFRNYLGFAVGLVIVLSLGVFAVPKTQERKYAMDLVKFNVMPRSFTAGYYAQTPEEQQKAKNLVIPSPLKVRAGLNALGLAMLLFAFALVGLAGFKRKFTKRE